MPFGHKSVPPEKFQPSAARDFQSTHQPTRTGLGSHAAVMRGVDWLKRNEIPFHVIGVLSADGLDQADAIFDFFVENGIRQVGFNMEETEGENDRSSLDIPDAERRYLAFLRRFWQRLQENPGALQFREFEGITGLAATQERLANTDMNWPFVIVNVDANGNISFSHTLANDLTTEGPETLLIKLFSDSGRSQQLGSSQQLANSRLRHWPQHLHRWDRSACKACFEFTSCTAVTGTQDADIVCWR